MINLKELKEHDKIISNIDCKINEILIKDNIKYLYDGKNEYLLNYFKNEDFYLYDKDKNVGEYDFKFFG